VLVGSSRSPIWVGGGVVFGPKPRDYSQRVNKKMRKAALRSALADKASMGCIWVLEGFSGTKTKAAAAVLAGAGIEGRVLVVVNSADQGDAAVRCAFRNLAATSFSSYTTLSAYDVLVAQSVLFTASAWQRFTAKTGSGGRAGGGAEGAAASLSEGVGQG
jgi:large subunit ribosomal protein L4